MSHQQAFVNLMFVSSLMLCVTRNFLTMQTVLLTFSQLNHYYGIYIPLGIMTDRNNSFIVYRRHNLIPRVISYRIVDDI